ncbi:MAG: hypothetical protein ACI8R9_001160 [Paraglaciecola sp.]|jgi:hypothetical protein
MDFVSKLSVTFNANGSAYTQPIAIKGAIAPL